MATSNVHYEGSNRNPGTIGVYSEERERLGPNAFNLVSGQRITDCSAKWLNRDCLYSGTPGKPTDIDVLIQRFHGYDSGRAFLSVVSGDKIIVEDFVAERVAHTVLNCEPSSSTDVATNVVLRRGHVGNSGYFLVSSKGFGGRPASATVENVRSISGTSVGNLLWARINATSANKKRFVFSRVAVDVRNDITDSASFTDEHGVQVTVPGDRTKAVYSINCEVVLEDVWINGRPIAESDVQWQWVDSRGHSMGIAPVITHTPGFTPSQIVSPSGVPGYTVPDPTPDPDPVDPCAACESALDVAEFEIGLLRRERDDYLTNWTDARAQVVLLQAKLEAARSAVEQAAQALS